MAGDPRWPGGRSGGGAEADVLAFLELVEKQVPADLEVLAILTSGSAGAGQLLARWLEDPRRARWHLQLTPAGSSWQSLVEPWLRELCRAGRRDRPQPWLAGPPPPLAGRSRQTVRSGRVPSDGDDEPLQPALGHVVEPLELDDAVARMAVEEAAERDTGLESRQPRPETSVDAAAESDPSPERPRDVEAVRLLPHAGRGGRRL